MTRKYALLAVGELLADFIGLEITEGRRRKNPSTQHTRCLHRHIYFVLTCGTCIAKPKANSCCKAR
jgi:hypothetical protein